MVPRNLTAQLQLLALALLLIRGETKASSPQMEELGPWLVPFALVFRSWGNSFSDLRGLTFCEWDSSAYLQCWWEDQKPILEHFQNLRTVLCNSVGWECVIWCLYKPHRMSRTEYKLCCKPCTWIIKTGHHRGKWILLVLSINYRRKNLSGQGGHKGMLLGFCLILPLVENSSKK